MPDIKPGSPSKLTQEQDPLGKYFGQSSTFAPRAAPQKPTPKPAVVPTEKPSQLTVVKQLSTLQQKAIVRPNNPPLGIAGFLFDITGDEWVELSSQITDHFTEANTAIQDNIALEPEKVTVRGLVAELRSFSPPPQEAAPVTNPLPDNVPMTPPITSGATEGLLSTAGIAGVIGVAAKTTALGILARKAPGIASAAVAFGPAIIAGARERIATAGTAAVGTLSTPSATASLNTSGTPQPGIIQSALGVIKSVIPKMAKSLLGALKKPTAPASQKLLGGAAAQESASTGTDSSLLEVYEAKQPTPPNQTRQSSAFLYFYALWKGRQLFSIETPWGIWTNMAILSLRAEQREASKSSTDFTITFKKIRTTEAVTIQLGELAGRNAFQTAASAPTQNGNVGQTPVPPADKESILRSIFKPGP